MIEEIKRWSANNTYNALPLAFITAVVLYLAFIALTLSVDYFDSFQTLQNSRYLLGLPGARYSVHRPVFISIAYLIPMFSERLGATPTLALALSHAYAMLWFIGFLVATFLFLRDYLNHTHSLIGLCLIVLNPLVLHYAPFCKEDIPAACLYTLALRTYLRWLQLGHRQSLILTIVFTGVAMVTRYNLIPVFALGFLVCPLLNYRPQRSMMHYSSHLLLAGSSLAFFLILGTSLYLFFGIGSHSAPFLGFVRDLFVQYQDNFQGYRPPHVTLVFLLKSLSIVFTIAFFLGMRFYWARYRNVVLWIFLYLAIHSFLIPGKEARYLLPIFPFIYLLVMLGFIHLLKSFGHPTPLTVSLLSILLLSYPLFRAGHEIRRFSDPVYRNSFVSQLASRVQEMAQGKQIIWVGPFYPLHPSDYIFDARDDYTYIYHLYNHVIAYYSRRPIPAAQRAGDPYFPTHLLNVTSDGDIIILNPEPRSYRTENLPKVLKPIELSEVKISTFSPLHANALHQRFLSRNRPNSQIEVSVKGEKLEVRGKGLTHPFEIYLFDDKTRQGHSMGWIKPLRGEFSLDLVPSPGQPHKTIGEIRTLSLNRR